MLRITLNRPDAGNAIHYEQRNEIIGVLEEAGADLAVRAVVIGATGKHFCTGADLRAAQPGGPDRPEGAPDRAVGEIARGIQRGAQRLIAAVLDCPKPVIAAVNGTAAGLGANLALACDLVVAARVGEVHPGVRAARHHARCRHGVPPPAPRRARQGQGAGVLRRRSPRRRGRLASGWSTPASPTTTWTRSSTSGRPAWPAGPTTAIGLSKWLLNRSLQSDRHGAFEDEAWAQDLASRTSDFGEGVAAFVERRDVEFRGW